MAELTDVSQNQQAEITIVSTVSKAGGRYVVGLPSKYKDVAQRYLGSHVIITLKPVI